MGGPLSNIAEARPVPSVLFACQPWTPVSPDPPGERADASKPPLDLLDFSEADREAREADLKRTTVKRTPDSGTGRGQTEPVKDLLDFTKADQKAEEDSLGTPTTEVRLGATWLQAGSLSMLSFSFILLGIFTIPGVPIEVQAGFLFLGALVLLVGGEWLFRLDHESFYPRGLTFGGLKLAYGGAWALYFHMDLVGADPFMVLWLAIFTVHAGFTQRYLSQTLHASAVLLAVVGLSLAADLEHLDVEAYAMVLMCALALGAVTALWRRWETAVLGALAVGFAWLALSLAEVDSIGGIPLATIERESGLMAGVMVLALALSLQAFLAQRQCLIGELHPSLPERYLSYGAVVTMGGTFALAAGFMVGAEGVAEPGAEAQRMVASGLVGLAIYGLLAGYLPLERTEPLGLRWALGGGAALLLLAGILNDWHQGLVLVSVGLVLGWTAVLVVRQLRRLSEGLLAGGWALLTAGLTLAAVLGWVGPEGLGPGLIILHLIFVVLLWKRSAIDLALLLTPVLAIWSVLFHQLLGEEGTEGWPALTVAGYLMVMALAKAHLRPDLRPFRYLFTGGSEGADWVRGQKWLHIFNLELGTALVAGALAAAHLDSQWQALALVLPLVAFTLLHMSLGGAWGRLGLPAAWLACAWPAALILQIPLVIQVGALALAVLLVVLKDHPQDWALMLIVLAAVGGGAFSGTVEVEGMDPRWLMVGVALALLSATFPRVRDDWSVAFGTVVMLVVAYAAVPEYPGPYIVALGTMLLWGLFTLEPPATAGRYRLFVSPFLGALTTMWLIVFGFTGEMGWEGVWTVHFGSLIAVWTETRRAGLKEPHRPWLIAGLLLPLAPALVTQGEDATGYLAVLSLGATVLAGIHWSGRPLSWMVPWGAATLAGLHVFAMLHDPAREVLGWELVRDMAVVTLLVFLFLGTIGPHRDRYRWYDVVPATLLLLMASSFDLQIKGDWSGLVLAAPLVGPAIFALGLMHRDVIVTPLGYLGALAVIYVGLERMEGAGMAGGGLVLGLLILLGLGLIWERWGTGEPLTFAFTFTALLLLLPAYFYLEPMDTEAHLLSANLAYTTAGNLALAGGFLLERRYLRLGAAFFLLAGIILNLWALPELGGGTFAVILAYWSAVLLAVSMIYWHRQRRELVVPDKL